MLLVRIQPCAGESLSSWRQRLAIANAFHLYPLVAGEFKHSDTDLAWQAEPTAWLIEHTGFASKEIEALSLKSLDKSLLAFGSGRAAPRWVIPLHYSRRDTAFGSQYCPLCLAEDKIPFFRLRWRLALSSCCPVHSCGLLDACPTCGQPAWPRSASLRGLYKNRAYPVHICPVCETDLRNAPTESCVNAVDSLVDGANLTNQVLLNGLVVSAAEFAASMWHVCQLFIRNRPNQKIGKRETPEGHLARQLRHGEARSVEYLGILQRQALTNTAAGLFEAWPEKFLNFCEVHGVTIEHFSEYRAELPTWFHDVLVRHLARQKRGISDEQVELARRMLRSEGSKVSRVALGRILGSSGANAIKSITICRERATISEKRLLWSGIENYLKQAVSRKSSREVRLRNALAILLSVLTQRSEELILILTKDEVEELVAGVSEQGSVSACNSRGVRLLSKVARTYKRYKLGRSHKRPVNEGGTYFENFRGNRSVLRHVKKALRMCTEGIDPELKRSTGSFF